MKTGRKRICSIGLALLTAIHAVPVFTQLSASAETQIGITGDLSITADAGVLIPSVGINNIAVPVTGQQVPFSVTVPEYQNYSVSSVKWYDETYGAYLKSDDLFQEAHQYRLEATLQAKDGYFFDFETAAFVNNLPATVESFTAQQMDVTYAFGLAKKQIRSVLLKNVIRPVTGKSPVVNGITPAEPEVYLISERFKPEWRDRTGAKMSATARFKANEEYQLHVWLEAQEGCLFAKDDQIISSLFDNYAAVGEWSSHLVELIYTITPSDGTPIESVHIADVSIPKTGEYPNKYAAITLDPNLYQLDESNPVIWYDENNHTILPGNKAFSSGVVYTAIVNVVTDESHVFPSASQINATVNSKRATALDTDDVHRLSVSYTFEKTEGVETIDSVSIQNVKAPVAGRHAVFSTVSSGEPGRYSILDYNRNGYKNGVRWYEKGNAVNQLDEKGVFEDGKDYILNIIVKPASGYTLPENISSVVSTINGEDAKSASTTVDNVQYLLVYKEFSAAEARTYILQNAGITGVKQPYIGSKAALQDITAVGEGFHIAADYSDDKYQNGQMWCDEDNGKIVKPGAEFEEGIHYSFNVLLEADEGYVFPDDDSTIQLKGTVNGVRASVSTAGIGDGKYRLLWFTFLPRDNPVISEVHIDAPIQTYAGEAGYPETVSINGSHCHLASNLNTSAIFGGISWTDETAGITLTADDTCTANHRYTVEIYLEPDTGYSFPTRKTDVATYLNRSLVNCGGYNSNSNLLVVYYTYTAKSIKTIKDISICGVSQPYAYDSPVYTGILTNDGGYSISKLNSNNYKNGVQWYNEDKEEVLPSQNLFIADDRYSVNILLKADDGCAFAEDLSSITATINGNAATVSSYNSSTIRVHYTFGPAPNFVTFSQIKLRGLMALKAGDKPFYECPAVLAGKCHVSDYTHGNMLDGMLWYDETDQRELKSSDTFQSGHTYTLQILMEADTDYAFPNDLRTLKAYCGSREVKVSQFNDTTAFVAVEIPFTLTPSVASSFAVTGLKEPITGNSPAFSGFTIDAPGCHLCTVSEGNYTQGICWLNTDKNQKLSANDRFIEGRTYEVSILLETDDGVTFEDISGTINGKTATVKRYNNTDNIIAVSRQFTAVSFLRGDVDGNNEISSRDAQLALTAFLEQMLDGEPVLTDTQMKAADVDGNNFLSAKDCQYILSYFLYNTVLETPVDWDDIITNA